MPTGVCVVIESGRTNSLSQQTADNTGFFSPGAFAPKHCLTQPMHSKQRVLIENAGYIYIPKGLFYYAHKVKCIYNYKLFIAAEVLFYMCLTT